MKCPLCGNEVSNLGKCVRFPICHYYKKTEEINDNSSYIVFDIETTGLNKQNDRITEIGALKVVNGKVIDEFNMLVNPGYDENGNKILISQRITEITGITNSMVENEPEEQEAVAQFIEWCGDIKTYAGQNIIKFDIPFVKTAAKRAGKKFNVSYALDTLNIAKTIHLDNVLSNLKQVTLANYYGFSYNAHRAIDDVRACHQILKNMLDDGKGKNININPQSV